MVTVLVATEKGNRDPFASRSLAATRYVGHPKVTQGDSEHALMAHPRRMRVADIRDHL